MNEWPSVECYEKKNAQQLDFRSTALELYLSDGPVEASRAKKGKICTSNMSTAEMTECAPPF